MKTWYVVGGNSKKIVGRKESTCFETITSFEPVLFGKNWNIHLENIDWPFSISFSKEKWFPIEERKENAKLVVFRVHCKRVSIKQLKIYNQTKTRIDSQKNNLKDNQGPKSIFLSRLYLMFYFSFFLLF
jgi:hypothetical protein